MTTDERRAADRSEEASQSPKQDWRNEQPPPGTSGAFWVRGQDVSMKGSRTYGDFDQHYNVKADRLDFEDNLANDRPPKEGEDDGGSSSR